MFDLSALLAISHHAGQDVMLAQGGGGNTSVKSDDGTRLWIKASGLRLAQMRAGFGYLETDLPALIALVRDPRLRAAPRAAAHSEAVQRVQAATMGGAGLRPSLETTFHAVLGRVVLHTHPIYVNAFTCLAGGAALLADVLGAVPSWVPYAPPGYALGVAVDDACAGREELPEAVFLANHGLIATGTSADGVIALTRRLCAVGLEVFGALPVGCLDAAEPPAALAGWAEDLAGALSRRALLPAQTVVRPARYRALNEAAHEPERWLAAGALVPDDVVYCGRRVWVTAGQSPSHWLETLQDPTEIAGRLVVVVSGQGVVLAGPSEAYVAAAEENLLAHLLVRRLVARRGMAQPLAPEDIDYLAAMESERYRQAILGTV